MIGARDGAIASRRPSGHRGSVPGHASALLVDDQRVVRLAIGRALRLAGFDVVVDVASASAASAEIAARTFDIVISDDDLGPHGAGGIAVLELARERSPRTRRVYVSGTAPRGLEAHLASGLVERFHEKPLTLDQVRALHVWVAPQLKAI